MPSQRKYVYQIDDRESESEDVGVDDEGNGTPKSSSSYSDSDGACSGTEAENTDDERGPDTDDEHGTEADNSDKDESGPDTDNEHGTEADNNGSDESGPDTDDEQANSPVRSARSPSPLPIPQASTVKDSSQKLSEEAVSNAARIDLMEKMLANINDALNRFQAKTGPVPNDDVDESWKVSNDADVRANVGASTSSNIRWDHVKPFPSGIPASKMWEEWNRYIENFEIAASLSNVNDPVKRTQLLFLSMGDELQGIVKAAKLRPGLSNPNCYRTFVSNIQNYLRSMTDTAAEHEAFSRMKQETGESAVAFHARLMGKVRACNYSVSDEDRFVRAQLLSGLRNKDLVKQARTYGYDTNFIVQSATRDEAFELEARQRDESHILAVRSDHSRSSYRHDNHKQSFAGDRTYGPPVKQRRSNEVNRQPQRRRSRCPRCFLVNHRYGKCPALNRKCNECGMVGHYALACTQKQVNFVQNKRNIDKFAYRSDDDDQDRKHVEQDRKQV